MTRKTRTVTIKHLPSRIDRGVERAVMQELAMSLQMERPSIVLDCARLESMDAAATRLLLCCLEEAMKRNGDVRLSGLSADAREQLAAWDADGLFRIFDSAERAAESFQRRTAFVSSTSAQDGEALASEHAA